MPKQRTKEEMAAYQKERRARVTPDVTPPINVTPPPGIDVTPPKNVTPDVTPGRRLDLRVRLDQYKLDYLTAARRQDWERCTEINQEREPLFWELQPLEVSLPAQERYWLPARVLNQGLDLAKK